jgi:predicted SprT family Zn-dependent metalloprotease
MNKIKPEWKVMMQDPEGSSWRIVEFEEAWGRGRGYGMIHDCTTAHMFLLRHSQMAMQPRYRCEDCKDFPPDKLHGIYTMFTMGEA